MQQERKHFSGSGMFPTCCQLNAAQYSATSRSALMSLGISCSGGDGEGGLWGKPCGKECIAVASNLI